ncbi:MAG: oligosaccharide flippase family protein [Muribaculaceae bacterium]|nr:oligosaccharide flippase family protein [Muribaculaceae bacterium]
MKTKQGNLPRKILKSLGLFGGMQGVLILCALIRVKLIAIFIGSEGVGLFGIFNNTVDMFREVTQLNITQSAVRDVARNSTGIRLASIAYIIRRLVWILGVAGAMLLLVCSPFLSQYCFESSEYTWAFALLSIIIFMHAIQAGYLIIMQGTERYSKLVKAQLWGAIISITICAPMFYFWGIDSVIPSMMVYMTANLATTYLFRVHVSDPNPRPTRSEVFSTGKKFTKLGLYLTVSTFSVLLVDFIFKSWLNVTASTIMVGLYTAGFTIVNRYVGMVFTAISVEYYPRLSKIIHNSEEVSTHVSYEIKVALFVLIPLILFFIPLARYAVMLLYSEEFINIVPFISVAMIGTLFRATSWCFSYVILAKGDGKTFVVTEFISSAFFLIINILTYKYYGIRGMGYAYTLWYFLYLISTSVVFFRRYRYKLDPKAFRLLAFGTVAGTASLLLVSYTGWIAGVIFATAISLPMGHKLLKLVKK